MGCKCWCQTTRGGIERVAFYQLWAYGIACAIINPRRFSDFAKAMGYLEKTDRIDAKVIAHFAATKGIIPTPAPSQNQQRLSALKVLICRIILKRLGVAQAWKCSRMRQVVSDLTVQKQRLHTAHDEMARDGVLELISILKRQSKTLSAAIAELINTDPLWAQLDATLRSVKGVADRTVATLMADLPELGTLSNKAIAKLAGLAPLANDSGTRQGIRRTRGGRASGLTPTLALHLYHPILQMLVLQKPLVNT